jgi:hypothetical protein
VRLQKVVTKAELVRVCLGSAVKTGTCGVINHSFLRVSLGCSAKGDLWCDQPLFS